ncbi:uncharacterized protein LOC144115654 [Amblyomma americanum]
MSYPGAYPYSGDYATVLQPRYQHPMMMDPRMMGMYGPTMPYLDGPQHSDNHTQNLLFYICSLSFMCLFVVVMVYSAIEMRRRIHELATDAPNRTAYATVSSSTAETTVRPFRWDTGIDKLLDDSDDDRLVPDHKGRAGGGGGDTTSTPDFGCGAVVRLGWPPSPESSVESMARVQVNVNGYLSRQWIFAELGCSSLRA